MTLALFGIENDGLNLAVNLLVFFLVVIWRRAGLLDVRGRSRRLEDPMLVACATAASLFPFIGTIVYTIVRPPEYLEDRHERELEMKAAEKRLALLENRTCRNCGGEVEPSFLRCPTCMRKLKEPCRSCGKPLDPRWRVCPYCEAEVAASAASCQRRPRRAGAGRSARTEAGKRRSRAHRAPRAPGRPRPARRTTGRRRTATAPGSEAPRQRRHRQQPPTRTE